MNNKLEALFGRCNLSCSKISKSLCGKTKPCSTPIATLSGKTKRVRICKKGRSTVKLYPFITNTKRVKKRIHFRRKSGSSSCRSVLGAIVSDAKVHVITKKKSKRKKASSLVGQIPTKRISADDKEHDVGPAYHITPKQVENVYKAMRKGRSFSASKRVLWRNRHRLVLRRDSLKLLLFGRRSIIVPNLLKSTKILTCIKLERSTLQIMEVMVLILPRNMIPKSMV